MSKLNEKCWLMASTSRRYCHGSCPFILADCTRLITTAARGVDVSAPMIEAARHRAETARIDNVDFVVADAQVARNGGIAPADLAAIEAAAAEVGAIDRSQAQIIEQLQTRIGG